MRDAFVKKLTEKAADDPSIMLLVGDLGFGVVADFGETYPRQFLNCGVAEQSMVGIAAGMAAAGRRPFVYSIANFPTLRPLEQIRNDVCYHGLGVTIVSVGAGLAYGSLGYTHHAVEDISILRSLPGMRVFSPADAIECRAAVDEILATPGPAYLRLGKNKEPLMHEAPPDLSRRRADRRPRRAPTSPCSSPGRSSCRPSRWPTCWPTTDSPCAWSAAP